MKRQGRKFEFHLFCPLVCMNRLLKSKQCVRKKSLCLKSVTVYDTERYSSSRIKTLNYTSYNRNPSNSTLTSEPFNCVRSCQLCKFVTPTNFLFHITTLFRCARIHPNWWICYCKTFLNNNGFKRLEYKINWNKNIYIFSVQQFLA